MGWLQRWQCPRGQYSNSKRLLGNEIGFRNFRSRGGEETQRRWLQQNKFIAILTLQTSWTHLKNNSFDGNLGGRGSTITENSSAHKKIDCCLHKLSCFPLHWNRLQFSDAVSWNVSCFLSCLRLEWELEWWLYYAARSSVSVLNGHLSWTLSLRFLHLQEVGLDDPRVPSNSTILWLI